MPDLARFIGLLNTVEFFPKQQKLQSFVDDINAALPDALKAEEEYREKARMLGKKFAVAHELPLEAFVEAFQKWLRSDQDTQEQNTKKLLGYAKKFCLFRKILVQRCKNNKDLNHYKNLLEQLKETKSTTRKETKKAIVFGPIDFNISQDHSSLLLRVSNFFVTRFAAISKSYGFTDRNLRLCLGTSLPKDFVFSSDLLPAIKKQIIERARFEALKTVLVDPDAKVARLDMGPADFMENCLKAFASQPKERDLALMAKLVKVELNRKNRLMGRARTKRIVAICEDLIKRLNLNVRTKTLLTKVFGLKSRSNEDHVKNDSPESESAVENQPASFWDQAEEGSYSDLLNRLISYLVLKIDHQSDLSNDQMRLITIECVSQTLEPEDLSSIKKKSSLSASELRGLWFRAKLNALKLIMVNADLAEARPMSNEDFLNAYTKALCSRKKIEDLRKNDFYYPLIIIALDLYDNLENQGQRNLARAMNLFLEKLNFDSKINDLLSSLREDFNNYGVKMAVGLHKKFRSMSINWLK